MSKANLVTAVEEVLGAIVNIDPKDCKDFSELPEIIERAEYLLSELDGKELVDKGAFDAFPRNQEILCERIGGNQ